MTEYIFYLLRNGKSWCYNLWTSETLVQAFDREIAWHSSRKPDHYAILAIEPRPQPFINSIEDRAKALVKEGKQWPEGYAVVDGQLIILDKPLKSLKKNAEWPAEVFITTKPDPNRCMEGVRSLCEGYRSR